MKKNFVFLALCFSLLNGMNGGAFAKDKTQEQAQEIPSEWKTIDQLTADQYHFGFLHNYGLAWASVTRIQKKTDVSNFVWNDKMIGAFYELQTHDLMAFNDLWALNFMGRAAVYYPYSYTFRKVPQHTTQTILYSIDLFTAPVLTLNFGNILRANFEPGVHFMYQIHDKWNYFNIGVGAKANLEFPISSRWTAILGGMFTWDNGNFGSNGNVLPLDYTWEYQAQLGVRYTKKYLNNPSYVKYKPKPEKEKKSKKNKN